MVVLLGGGAFSVLKGLKLVEEETEETAMAVIGDGDCYPEISNFGDERLKLELELGKLEQFHYRFFFCVSNAPVFYILGPV